MRKIAMLIAVLLFSTATIFAQAPVKGKVTDKDGLPLSGVSIKIKGSSAGTTTGSDGAFELNAKPEDVLVFSSAGFEGREAKASSNLSISLVTDVRSLNEVVVTALGQSRSKSKIGYATTTVNNEQINRASPVSVLDGLAGKIAGANISKSGGAGSSTKVVLRGYGVIGNNQPLYVIDGIPLSDSRFATSDNVDFGNGLNDINPNDIESMSVLKGTAAASLYGSQAKNGAIMITTKRGKAGKLKVDYVGSLNVSQVAALPTTQSIFGQGWGGIFVLPENGSWGPRLDGKDRAWGSIVDNSQLIKPFSYVKNNIKDFYDKGLEFGNTISLSGGNEASQYYFSYGNVSSNGVLPSNADLYARNTVALRTNSKFNNFTINSSFNYVNKMQNVPFTGQGDPAGGSTFEELLQIPVDIRISDFADYKNKFFNVDNYFTPYAENPYYPLYENGNSQNSDRFFGNLDFGYKFNSKLSAQLRVGGDFANARTFRYKAVNAPAPGSWNAGGNTEGQSRAKDVGTVREVSSYAGSINTDFILKYTTALSSKFNLEVLGGTNFYQEEAKTVSATITELLVPGFYNLSNSTSPPTATDARSKLRRVGVYAQAILDYNNELFLTVNGRNDWSSTLPILNNHVFYPGGNIAWLASKTLNLSGSGLSYLKFRAGYGKTGSDAQSAYQIDPTLQIGSVTLPYGFVTLPFNGVSGFGVSNTIGNSNLKPVITKEAELGMEARFLNNMIGLDVSVYQKRTEGQIIAIPVSPGSGYTALIDNIGLVENKGIEVALDVKPVNNKNLTWAFTYTFSKNSNKVIRLKEGLDKIVLNTAYDAELTAYPGKSLTGIYAPVPKYAPDGRVIVSATTGMPVEDPNDKGFYGNADYDFMMGFLNTITFKNFQFGFSLDFRKGGVMYSGTADLLLFTGNSYATTYNDRRPFIVPNSVIEDIDPVTGKATYTENTVMIDEAAHGDYYYPTQNKAGSYANRIIDKSFLKLRDISLSYNLPKKLATKMKVSNLSLGIYGRNFLLWTPSSNFYVDPQSSNLGNDLGSELGEFRTAPSSVQYGASLKVSF